jgi:hypothetical protein
MTRGDGSRSEFQDAVQAYLTDQTGGRVVRRDQPNQSAPVGAPVRPSATDAGVDKGELTRAFDRLVEHEKTKPREVKVKAPEQWRKFVHPTIIGLSLTVITYIWAARPGWLFAKFDESASYAAPSPTHALVAVSALVDQFQQDRGRVPLDPHELGFPLPNIAYAPIGSDGFTLMTRSGDRSVTLEHRAGAVPSIVEVHR